MKTGGASGAYDPYLQVCLTLRSALVARGPVRARKNTDEKG